MANGLRTYYKSFAFFWYNQIFVSMKQNYRYRLPTYLPEIDQKQEVVLFSETSSSSSPISAFP